MFEKLKALFRRKKPEPTPAAIISPRLEGTSTPAGRDARASRSAPADTKRDDSNDLLSPFNPLGVTNPVSPLNPMSPLWHSSSTADTSDCSPSSGSSDGGGSSSSSCDSGSY